MTTPNKYTNPSPLNPMNSEINEFKQGPEPSPIRMPKLMSEEKDLAHKERDRLLRLAENLTRGFEQPSQLHLPSFQNEDSFKAPMNMKSPFKNPLDDSSFRK